MIAKAKTAKPKSRTEDQAEAFQWAWDDTCARMYRKYNAQDAGNEMMRLAKQFGVDRTSLEPGQLVEAAKPKNSYFHGMFEWDNEKAGSQHRIQQARRIITGIRYVIVDRGEVSVPLRGYTSLPKPEETLKRGYDFIPEAVRHKDRRDQMIGEALKYLESAKSRYFELSQAKDNPDVRAAFKALEDKVLVPLRRAASKVAKRPQKDRNAALPVGATG